MIRIAIRDYYPPKEVTSEGNFPRQTFLPPSPSKRLSNFPRPSTPRHLRPITDIPLGQESKRRYVGDKNSPPSSPLPQQPRRQRSLPPPTPLPPLHAPRPHQQPPTFHGPQILRLILQQKPQLLHLLLHLLFVRVAAAAKAIAAVIPVREALELEGVFPRRRGADAEFARVGAHHASGGLRRC